jgi:hypothetical protein
MQCQKVQRQISTYMDGELDSASSRNVECHISQCGACRKIVADFQKVDDMVRGLPRFEMGPDFVGPLVESVGASHSPVATKPLDQSLSVSVTRFMSRFMDLLEARRSPSTHALDEFGDFPPSSMGYIYFKLLDQPERG